jgi:hypothetical protein
MHAKPAEPRADFGSGKTLDPIAAHAGPRVNGEFPLEVHVAKQTPSDAASQTGRRRSRAVIGRADPFELGKREEDAGFDAGLGRLGNADGGQRQQADRQQGPQPNARAKRRTRP